MHEKARLLAYSAVQNGLNDGLQKALPQADTKWLELTAAVVQVLATDRAEERWLAGENVFRRGARRLSELAFPASRSGSTGSCCAACSSCTSTS